MSNYYKPYDPYKDLVAGPGSRLKDEVPICYTCRNRGWPNEPIDFKELPDGTLLKLDRFTGQVHLHKERRTEVDA
ncbi:MAG: hypothetical protein ACRD8W_21185 [Nitrososphaeraceae archaeon]